MTGRSLSYAEARSFYDRLGRGQDLVGRPEDPAVEALLGHADFGRARAVVEFGCGTGRLAARLLAHELPAGATYTGFDISATMVRIARARLSHFGPRAWVVHTSGRPVLPLEEGSCDRFLATYVIDLLSDADGRTVVEEAHRLLRRRGLVCLTSLTAGATPVARAVEAAWLAAYRLRPQLVGGCRPVDLAALVGPGWRAVHRETRCRWGLCSAVVVAEKPDSGAA